MKSNQQRARTFTPQPWSTSAGSRQLWVWHAHQVLVWGENEHMKALERSPLACITNVEYLYDGIPCIAGTVFDTVHA
jgi:hypothetical protein